MNRHTRILIVVSSVVVLLLFLVASSVMAAAPPLDNDYKLGVSVVSLPRGGCQIVVVDPGGPASKVRVPSGVGYLEQGDIITHVNDNFIRSGHDLRDLINASDGREVWLTVIDVRSGRYIQCLATPRPADDLNRSTDPRPNMVPKAGPPNAKTDFATDPQHEPAQIVNDSSGGAIKVLLIGLSSDPSIGISTYNNVKKLDSLFRDIPGISRQSIHQLLGQDVTAANILRSVQELDVEPKDTLFCYYAGHGGYDPRYANDTSSKGHFLQIPSGDLLRRKLVSELKKKDAGLTVLITESCNAWATARTITRNRVTVTNSKSNKAFNSLLRDYSGFLDINSSSMNEYAWASPTIGWFTFAFCDSVEQLKNKEGLSWDELIRVVKRETQSIFLEEQNRARYAGVHPLAPILQQRKQEPMVFEKTITKNGE